MLRADKQLGILALLVLAACGGDKGTTVCTRDADCPSGQICVGVSSGQPGTCQPGSRADGGRVDGGPRVDGGATDGGRADGGAQDGGAMDGGGADGGAADGGTPADVVEAESPTERTNDSLAGAESVAIGNTIDGTIGDYDAGTDTNDQDIYKFTASAGNLLRITVSARGDYEAIFLLRNQDGSYVRLGQGNSPTATRQLFIPSAGEYFLLVADARNTGDVPANVGGAANTYRIQIQQATLSPSAETLPVTSRAGAIDAEGSVPAFGFTATTGQGLVAETRATRLTLASNVDTVLYIMDNTTPSAPAVLGFNDDIDAAGGVYDSLVREVVRNSGSHYVVLDFYGFDGPNRNYEISISSFDTSMEQEPNDPRVNANPFAGAGATVSGAITKVADGVEQGDLDYFKFTATEGKYYEILVTKPAGSDSSFQPHVAFIDPTGAVTFLNPNKPGNSPVRLEAYAFQTGTHFIRIADARNIGATTFVGGATFTYQVAVTEITRTVTNLGDVPVQTSNNCPTALDGGTPNRALGSGAIDQGGKTVWFSFTVPAGMAKIVWMDFDLRSLPDGGADGFNVNPFMVLYGTDGKTPLAGGPVLFIRDLPLEPGTYTLAVSDLDGAFSAGKHLVNPRILPAGDLAMVVDDGSHTTPGAALSIAPPAVVAGTLTAGGENWYSLGTLNAGERLTLFTTPGADGVTTDTQITLYQGAAGTTEVANNDDFGGSLLSRIEGFRIATSDTYLVKIHGGLASSAGAYRLFALKGGCPGPTGNEAVAPSDLFINEVFPAPSSSDGGMGDANGDGTTSATNDEFVEIVNFSNRAKNLSGVVLRDAFGMRFRGSCVEPGADGGGLLAASKALAIFTGCPLPDGGLPDGGTHPCLTKTTLNADACNPLATSAFLGPTWDNTGDLVILLGPEGEILDRVSYSGSTSNVSFARGSGGTCDAKPTTADVQLATACVPACSPNPCGFTPGTKADGTEFQPPPPPQGDTCASAVVLTPVAVDGGVATVQLDNQTTVGFNDDYDYGASVSTACTDAFGGIGYDAADAVYRVLVPAGKTLTVTVTAVGGWDPAVGIVTDCTMPGPTCLSASDGATATETVSFANTAGEAVDTTVYIIVDGWRASEVGQFSIKADLN